MWYTTSHRLNGISRQFFCCKQYVMDCTAFITDTSIPCSLTYWTFPNLFFIRCQNWLGRIPSTFLPRFQFNKFREYPLSVKPCPRSATSTIVWNEKEYKYFYKENRTLKQLRCIKNAEYIFIYIPIVFYRNTRGSWITVCVIITVRVVPYGSGN